MRRALFSDLRSHFFLFALCRINLGVCPQWVTDFLLPSFVNYDCIIYVLVPEHQ